MNILFIGHEQDLNGASKSLLNIISVLEKEHKIFVLTAYHSGPFYDALQRHNVTVVVKPYYRWCVAKGSWKGWLKRIVFWNLRDKFVNAATAKAMAAYCLANRIDIIHSNTSVINIGALIKKHSGIPHIWHIREFADLDFHMYPLISHKTYYATMNKYADRFICISQAVCNHYKALDPEKKTVIYNGVDRSNILEERTESDKVRLLIAGRIGPAKGQWDAVCACEKLLQRGVDHFVLNLAGTGDLRHPVPETMTEHIRFLGQVADMPALRKSIDIELVCSTAEAFGRVTAEAMLGGIPVIGTNAGGTAELIQDGFNGYLYEVKDTDMLADKLEDLIQSPEKRHTMGENARSYALSHFMIERCVAEISTVYRQQFSACEDLSANETED